VADVRELTVEGPQADALLLAGWLRSRLQHDVALDHGSAEALRAVAVDGSNVPPVGDEPKTPSDLLSDQFEIFGRDRVYEQSMSCAT
jgi:glucose-6-phosphate dehydrogenase assembly protein OpcA